MEDPHSTAVTREELQDLEVVSGAHGQGGSKARSLEEELQFLAWTWPSAMARRMSRGRKSGSIIKTPTTAVLQA